MKQASPKKKISNACLTSNIKSITKYNVDNIWILNRQQALRILSAYIVVFVNITTIYKKNIYDIYHKLIIDTAPNNS